MTEAERSVLGTSRIPKVGEEILCVDDDGLDLGLIKVGQMYKVTGYYITFPSGKQKYKGFPLISEIAYILEGIEEVIKPNGRREGFAFSSRRFLASV